MFSAQRFNSFNATMTLKYSQGHWKWPEQLKLSK